MSYRPDKQAKLEWKRFKQRFQVKLGSVGIPDCAFSTQLTWLYFLQHCYLANAPELLHLERWSQEDLVNLLSLLEEIERSEFESCKDPYVINWIRCRVK